MKKRASDCLLGMLKERAFILEDIHADSIREIEILISDSCRLGVKRTYSDQPMEAISDQQRHAKRYWRKRLSIRNELNVCLTPTRKPGNDGR